MGTTGELILLLLHPQVGGVKQTHQLQVSWFIIKKLRPLPHPLQGVPSGGAAGEPFPKHLSPDHQDWPPGDPQSNPEIAEFSCRGQVRPHPLPLEAPPPN